MSNRIQAAEALLRLKAGNSQYVHANTYNGDDFVSHSGKYSGKTGNFPMPLLLPVPIPG